MYTHPHASPAPRTPLPLPLSIFLSPPHTLYPPYPPNQQPTNTPPQEGDPKPKSYSQANASVASSDGASTGVGLYAIVLVGAALAFGAYKYLQAQQGEQ